MYKVKICFSKQGYAKYISNLDMMRMFQRVFKMAEIDISYSQGFNPHQRMSIANPLPIGVTGDEEYLEIYVDTEPDYEKIKTLLNERLPDFIRVINACESTEALSALNRSQYEITFYLKKKIDNFNEYINALKNKSDIVVSKKTKRGISNVDIKPYIYNFEVLYADGIKFELKAVLSTGEEMNLKATSLLDACKKYVPGFELDYYIINRVKTFRELQ